MATSPLPSQGPTSGEKSTWLHYPCLLGVPMVGRNQYGYINPAFAGSPWKKGVDVVEMSKRRVKTGLEMGDTRSKNPKMPTPRRGRSIKTCC